MSEEIYFAGFAYLTDYQDVSQRLPCTSRVVNDTGAQIFDRQLFELATSVPCQAKINDGLGTLKAGRAAYVTALAVNHEITDVERIGNQYKLSVTLWGQLLVFDFQSKSVVSSTPVVSQFIDLFDTDPTEDEILAAYGRLVNGEDAGGLKSQFAKAISGSILPRNSSRTIRVTQSTLSEKARQQVIDLRLGGAETYTANIASRLSGWLTSQQKICVLPAASNQALGGKMAARLSNGDVYTLNIPAPDYELHLTLDGFKKVLVTDVPAGKGYVYGAFVTLMAVEPLSATRFFEAQIRVGVKRTQPATASEINDGPVFDEALQELFMEFTQAIEPADDAWARQNILPTQTAVSSMQALRKMIQTCR
ncbi:hypothetical protein [Asticcacaulis benevestitus]|uniref:Uncharacterized protein n=1 Tax=Asticcacaulis benevestitus DSM 16100 = ATCC BAA-896 TaxID=1121022 RepID=V4RB75_9CAUL|nr:hypothetical protein [Asticcacaulis benevestitus]ESQ88668.1 hypothetical protein ABENE_15615 [Asticcacaulis benevestitus DSM 16100 = ATCC BAA-896]